jgi:hypothetical protein
MDGWESGVKDCLQQSKSNPVAFRWLKEKISLVGYNKYFFMHTNKSLEWYVSISPTFLKRGIISDHVMYEM